MRRCVRQSSSASHFYSCSQRDNIRAMTESECRMTRLLSSFAMLQRDRRRNDEAPDCAQLIGRRTPRASWIGERMRLATTHFPLCLAVRSKFVLSRQQQHHPGRTRSLERLWRETVGEISVDPKEMGRIRVENLSDREIHVFHVLDWGAYAPRVLVSAPSPKRASVIPLEKSL